MSSFLLSLRSVWMLVVLVTFWKYMYLYIQDQLGPECLALPTYTWYTIPKAKLILTLYISFSIRIEVFNGGHWNIYFHHIASD
jgi:hypothetical protein